MLCFVFYYIMNFRGKIFVQSLCFETQWCSGFFSLKKRIKYLFNIQIVLMSTWVYLYNTQINQIHRYIIRLRMFANKCFSGGCFVIKFFLTKLLIIIIYLSYMGIFVKNIWQVTNSACGIEYNTGRRFWDYYGCLIFLFNISSRYYRNMHLSFYF